MTAIAISGHRPDKFGIRYSEFDGETMLSDRDRELRVIRAVDVAFTEAFKRERPTMLFIGMAQGVDLWVAGIAVNMGIPFTACIPCRNQIWRWGRTWTDLYVKRAKQAAKVIYTSNEMLCSPRLYKRRNAFMVDQSEKLIALWDSTPGGTAHAVRYAEATNTPVVNVYDRFRELFNPASP